MTRFGSRRFLAVVVLSASLTIPAAAQVSDIGSTTVPAGPLTYGAMGFYIEPLFSTCSIGGNFDGLTYLTDGYEQFLMPKIDSALGLGISLGYRTAGQSYGLYYYGSSHNMTYGGAPFSGSYSGFGLIFMQQFAVYNRLQPYVMTAINMARVTVARGGFTATQVGDAVFTGFGIDAGVGALFYVTPQIFIRAGLLYREMMLGWAKGLLNESKLMSTLYLDVLQTQPASLMFVGGLGLTVSVGYTF